VAKRKIVLCHYFRSVSSERERRSNKSEKRGGERAW
jgi:hypothetical protein